MARYVLGKRIGAGGMAEVFRARALGESGFSRPCAVKRLLPELAGDAAVQARFVQEARIAATLDHPCIVAVFDFFEERGANHLVMELVDGTSAEQLYLGGIDGRFLPVPAAALVVREVARALDFAHARGVLHRDVSLANVLVSRLGEVKLADFGLAVARERLVATDPGTVAGKLAYLSPERRRGAPATPADDVWALGIVLARLLAAADPRERSRVEAQKLVTLQKRLVAPDRERRLRSPAELLAALSAVPTCSPELLGALVTQASVSTSRPAIRRLVIDDLDDTTTQDGQFSAEDTTAPADPASAGAMAVTVPAVPSFDPPGSPASDAALVTRPLAAPRFKTALLDDASQTEIVPPRSIGRRGLVLGAALLVALALGTALVASWSAPALRAPPTAGTRR